MHTKSAVFLHRAPSSKIVRRQSSSAKFVDSLTTR